MENTEVTTVTEPEPKPAKVKKPRKPKAPKAPKAPKPETLTLPADFAGLTPPKSLWKARSYGSLEYTQRNGKKVKGKLHLPGKGSKTAQVMFISPSVLREEEWSNWDTDPMMLKGPAANLFLRCLLRTGFKEEEWFYTALCKYNVPGLKPKAEDIRWNRDMLDDEIMAIKPKIIVCLGKTPFDHLFKLKFKLKDIQGGFFRSDKYDCLIYPMDSIMLPVLSPEYLERFITDLKEVRKALNELNGITIPKIQTHYQVIENSTQLKVLMEEFAALQAKGGLRWLSTDCEWAGQTAWGGMLRSIQFCWKPGYAAYVKIRDENCKHVFDISLREIADIMRPVLENPVTGFVGHNAVADMCWYREHLDINTTGRVVFDTMFAQQVCNEYDDLKLERMAVKHTDLGRYDIELLMWKKNSGFDDDDNKGYGEVPDKIIIPYGCRDVDATMRLAPILYGQLVKQNLLKYYNEVALPFVTDGFQELMSTGLPIDREYLDEMRTTFARNRDILLGQFRSKIKEEAEQMLLKSMSDLYPPASDPEDDLALSAFSEMVSDVQAGDPAHALEVFKSHVGKEELDKLLPYFEHWLTADKFNINSVDHVKRWLFEVKKFKPFKTTKKDGVQMAWEKVETLPPEKQAQFSPSADKQTLKVFAQTDPMCAHLEEIKSVGNIIKSFLKEPDEKGREQGMHKWIQEDERIHANYALTETGRSRTWSPNVLNFPKVISKPIERAFERINRQMVARMFEEVKIQKTDIEINAYLADIEKRRSAEGSKFKPVDAFEASVVDQIDKPVSLRSAVKAPEGWCIVSMDLKTAEVVALAHISGDENMLKVLSEPDTQFARISTDNPKKVVRICYNENEGIPDSEHDTSLLVGEDDPRILRDDQGRIIHPKRDVHFEMATSVLGKPREKLDEERDRGMGKVGVFSIPYGAAAPLLERMVEVGTGKKPPDGTGEKMIKAYETRFPTASRFLKAMELVPSQKGTYRSISGRVRHFYFNNLQDVDGLSEYSRNGILSPLTRQARNYPMQELVAATASKALKNFIRLRNDAGKQAQCMMVLYDAMDALCPLEELKWTVENLRACMTTMTPWTIHGRTFHFDVDVSVCFRWGTKLSKEEKEIVKRWM